MGYPRCGGYNKYRLRGLPCSQRLDFGRIGTVGLLNHCRRIGRVVNVAGPCRCHGGIRTTFAAGGNGVLSKICRSSARGVITISDYVVRSRGTSRVVIAVEGLLGDFGLGAFSSGAFGNFLHRILVGQDFALGRIVIILIANAHSFPGREGFMGTLLSHRDRVAAVIRGMGGGHADLILNTRDHILCNSKCVRSRLLGGHFHVSPGTFCRMGPARARILCNGTLRFTSLGNGRAIVSACYNANAVNVLTSSGTGHIVNIRLGTSTMGSTGIGTRLGGTNGVRFCRTSTNGFVDSLSTINRGTRLIVVSPPHTNTDLRFLQSLIALLPRGIICVSYGLRALSHSLSFLAHGNCGIQGVRPISVFPRARRVRYIILLRHVDTWGGLMEGFPCGIFGVV